ncbi:unnamed protein product [Urochloa decumbens]|uniref:F-box domain-containing protein n=1 Tax=Urochloa decumbens TaxID=240449 RepID=A0ABC8YVX1_9POAL
MDLLCDYVVEEILLWLPLKYLHRLRAVSRRYNALILNPGFATRYWRSHGPHLSGVFLQSERLLRPWGSRPTFLAAPGRRTSSVLAPDLGGRERQTQFYLCNPVTWQCVALPELPWPHEQHQWHSGLLTLAGDGYGNITSFQVVLVNHPSRWPRKHLKVFSSETGEWRQHESQLPSLDVQQVHYPRFLAQSGTAYWIGTGTGIGLFHRDERAIVYNSFYDTINVILLPARNRAIKDGDIVHNRCLGERCGGGGLRYARFDDSAFEVWDLLWDVQAGRTCWMLVHRVDVLELAKKNEEATSFFMREWGVNHEGVTNLVKRNDLFHVLGFHPTEDGIVYFDVGRSVAAYSMARREITLQSPRQCYSSDLFPYVHPPYPVLIPEIKNNPKLAPPSELLESLLI